MKKLFLSLLFVVSFLTGTTLQAQSDTILTPHQALRALELGNKRFISEPPALGNRELEEIIKLEKGQTPFAAVVGCSDSRVPIEFIFDQGFGNLFVIRNAGNTLCDEISQGSVDYGVNHANVKLIVVLGHTGCGAITAVVSAHDNHDNDQEHGDDDGDVPVLIEKISSTIPQYVGKQDKLNEAIIANIKVQVDKLNALSHIKNKVDKGTLLVVPALYDLKSGIVSFYPY